VMEHRYREARRPFRLAATRTVFAMAAIISAVFTLLNGLTIRDPSAALLGVRLSAVIVMLAGLAATYIVKPGRWVELAAFAMVGFNIVFLSFVLAFMSRLSLPYYSPLAISMVQGIACFGLSITSFVEGVMLAPVVAGAFFVAVTVLWPEPPLFVLFDAAWVFTAMTLSGVGAYLLDRTQRIAWLRQVALAEADERIRELLHNVLPPSIAARKLRGEVVIADNFSEASLLFADVVGFTALSAGMKSTELVALLSDLFARFDRIVARHGLEKIKTIGDCYMIASGIPQARPDHLRTLMRAAVEMLGEVGKVRAPDGRPLTVRIGVNTGPVTAGVIGESKFIFDVWGDTVNVASRMESNGAAGQIQVTEAVTTALAGLYAFDGPQLIDVKGKGPTRVWKLRAIPVDRE
jgi:adenylate cyclase